LGRSDSMSRHVKKNKHGHGKKNGKLFAGSRGRDSFIRTKGGGGRRTEEKKTKANRQ